MGLSNGVRLGSYEILAPLGAGGMGEVYRARDLRLGREVALKVLPSERVADPRRRARFEREARAVASLNHPHIVTLFSLEESEGTSFLTMELVEGETIASVVARGPVESGALLRVASEITEAVAYAHGRGILHRDLKPSNVMLTADGRVKVLDFGLAKLRRAEREGRPASGEAETPTELLTDGHVVMGTPAYMSPEQAEGRPLDERSDLFSLGILLYELASGQRPFRGRSTLSVLAAVLHEAPRPLEQLSPAIPPGFVEAVMRCLEKDPAARYPTARALKADLDALSRPVEGKTVSLVPSIHVPPAPNRSSVAVLPFLNLTPDPENEFFADGVTEDVIAQLSKLRSLKVISRTSVTRVRRREESLREIAARLGVSSVVEGSIRRAGDRVRIVAQLVDVETEACLWGETFDRRLTDIFEIQAEVALRIAEGLRLELSTDEKERVAGPAPVGLEAYEAYLRGRELLHRYTEAGIRQGLACVEKAVALEPRYASAHEQVAFAYLVLGLGYGGGWIRPREAHARAKAAVARALELDPRNGEAHGTLGALRFMAEYDWPGAEQSLGTAVRLNPGSPFAFDLLGLMLSALERYDEALAAQRRSRELDPLTMVHTTDLATTLIRAGRLEEAAREARHAVEAEPSFPLGHSALGWALLLEGEREPGLREIEAAVALSPESTLLRAQLGEALALAGQERRAREVLDGLVRSGGERYVQPYHLAYVHTGLGEHERAIDLLEAAVEEGGGGAYGIKGSFLFAPLRGHPRFRALLRRINLSSGPFEGPGGPAGERGGAGA